MNKKGTRALASATVVGLVLATVATGNVKAAPGDVNKVQGNDRYETAANVAKANWKDGAKDVIIASGEGYADSLSASVLAKKLNAPIILTTAGELNSNAKSALQTLKPENVYVIGGNASVSEAVRSGLKKDYKVTELGGKTRFETNLAVANHLVDKLGVKADNVMVVNGQDGFSDALSAAPVAAAKEQVLLIVGRDASTADAAANFVKKHNSKVTVIGTEGVVPAAVYNKLGASERVNGGADRFETNLNIMKHFKLNADTMYVANATGQGYADALVASALAGKSGAPLVLVDTKDSQSTKNAIKYIADNKTDKTEVSTVGGSGVMPDEIVNEIETAVNPELSAAEKAVKAYEDAKIGTSDEIAAAKALKADAVKAVDNVKDATKKSAFEARIAAKDKAISDAEAKLEIKVESATAINAKEIKVVFNREVNKDSAESESNYTLYEKEGNKDAVDLKDKFTAKLQDDNKTVVLRMNDSGKLSVGRKYKTNVKDVVDTNYKKMKDYEGDFVMFEDSEDPKVLKAEYTGASEVKLTFNEPLDNTKDDLTVKIDGKEITKHDYIDLSKMKDNAEGGNYEVKLTNLDNDAKKVGKHQVVIYNAKDFAGNDVDVINCEYTATENNSTPVVEKLEVKNDIPNTFRIKLNTTVQKLDKANIEIKNDGYKLPTDKYEVAPVANEDYTYEVRIYPDKVDETNPLFEEGKDNVTLNVKVKDFMGENGVAGKEYNSTVKLAKDFGPAVLAESSNTVKEGNTLSIVFDKQLDSAEKNNIIVTDEDGVKLGVKDVDIDGSDAKKLLIEMNDSLDAGTYKVEFKKDAVKSIVTEKGNKEVTTKVKYDGVTDEVKVIDKSNVTVETVDENKNEINVDYKEKMDSSALDPANYFIDGRSLTEKYGKDNKDLTLRFKDSDKEVVLIELPKGQIEHKGLYKFEISNKVKTDSGRIVANNASEKKNVIIDLKDLLHDDKAPVIDDVEFVKANSNDTKTNVIKVTFDEDLKEDIKKAEEKGIANDFEIRSNGSYMKVKSVSIGNFTDNKDEAVIVLDKEINIDVRNTTIRLTDNEDYPSADNYNEDGINIVDLAGNEAEATKAQTITKSEKDSTLFDKIKATDKAEADKAAEKEAVKSVNEAKADTMAKVIKDNSAVLGLDLTAYDKLKDKTLVYNALVGQNFADKDAVKKAFNDAVTKQQKVEDDAVATEAANNAIGEAKGLLEDKALGASDDNLLTVLNAIPSMADKGVTLAVKEEASSDDAKIAVDGKVTKGTAQKVIDVTITISKDKGTTEEKVIKVTVPQA
ncbi:cell wall-binding repeat-containing protein [Clostridium botulinum]|uniref:Cell wall-binding repeat-containing protein n=1 Tax=Clostridium botulinum TaxID=1491 RepID=A0A6G4HTK8_CLOBO|nr:cell wall-binding repeat-containing protein [Clostridium botulinum]MBD5588746.1 cell wall-binding repeat-containing protein [Clostridium botulinum]MBO0571149.1 cell wall-binding repeat-containing protein [Clostridium botulinum]NFJ60385.1 cell wall-binding repeat-containing protein [Clostridium botulinum]NFJ69205.1 cell wall-binding repeat-containing protein [Clostridium botulinum]NFQ63143.1 cell wall-binding repeat-containing protein [Clostridium botulinum]